MKLTIAVLTSLATLSLAQGGPPPGKTGKSGPPKGKGGAGGKGFGGKINQECISCFTSALSSSGCQSAFPKMGGMGGFGKGKGKGGMGKGGMGKGGMGKGKGGKMGGMGGMGGMSPVFPPPSKGPSGGKGGPPDMSAIMKGVTDFRDCMCKAQVQDSVKGCSSKCGSSGGAGAKGGPEMLGKMCSVDLSQLGKGMGKMGGMGKGGKGKMGGKGGMGKGGMPKGGMGKMSMPKGDMGKMSMPKSPSS